MSSMVIAAFTTAALARGRAKDLGTAGLEGWCRCLQPELMAFTRSVIGLAELFLAVATVAEPQTRGGAVRVVKAVEPQRRNQSDSSWRRITI
jgi:hypothetical protein